MRAAIVIALGCGVLGTPAWGRAQYGAAARIDAPAARGADEDAATAATRHDARRSAERGEDLDDVVARTAGASVRRTGGRTAYASVSLRGADAEQTQVTFGGVPLVSATGAAFDLSTIPLEVVESVTIYRGVAPLTRGLGAIGGTVALEPRRAHGRRWSLSLGAGAFGLRRGSASLEVRTDDDLRYVTAISALAERGDHEYLDDGGTAFDAGDDVVRRRTNADAHEGALLMTLAAPVAGGDVGALILASERYSGVPGPAIQPTAVVRRHVARVLASSRLELGGVAGARAWMGTLSVSADRQRVRDPLGEVGLGVRDADDLFVRALAQTAGAMR